MKPFPLIKEKGPEKGQISVKLDNELIERLRKCLPPEITITDVVNIAINNACEFYEENYQPEDEQKEEAS